MCWGTTPGSISPRLPRSPTAGCTCARSRTCIASARSNDAFRGGKNPMRPRRLTAPLLLLGAATVSAAFPDPEPPFYPDKANLLVYREDGKEHPVKTPAEWEKRRRHILANMELVMGR